MNALTELPVPQDAPPAGSCVRLERPEPGLAVVVLDPPHRKLAVFDLALMRDLEAAVDELARDGSLKGVVFTGRTPTSFAAGADIEAIAHIEDKAEATRLAAYGQALFQKIASLQPRTVAAVGGPVPGGACELSLACDRIVLADDPATRIGLPETRLGILPGWGGCQRLPRRVGVPKALAAILAGKLYRARQAKRLGLVDRLTFPEYLVRVASEIALGRMPCKRVERGVWRWLVDRNPVALGLIGKRVAADLAKQTGGHYPAQPTALKLVLNAPRTPLEVGLQREAEALGRLAVSPECKNLVGIFQLSEEAKRLGKTAAGEPGRAIDRAAAIGGGVMGAAIAGLMAERGLDVRLADIAREPLDAALVEHAKRVAKARSRHVFAPHEATAALDRLTVTTSFDGLAHRGLVIEAVAEQLEIKR
ncbi:MAG TPA: enoyl-CoA hydratase-related protein, partial [Myxococcota bacterium]|nr:enoyl-CoA hydratase-related protein [Myxococcota bacterium]